MLLLLRAGRGGAFRREMLSLIVFSLRLDLGYTGILMGWVNLSWSSLRRLGTGMLGRQYRIVLSTFTDNDKDEGFLLPGFGPLGVVGLSDGYTYKRTLEAFLIAMLILLDVLSDSVPSSTTDVKLDTQADI